MILISYQKSNVINSPGGVSVGGATWPLPRVEDAEKFHGNPTVGLRPNVCTRDKNGRSSAKDARQRGLDAGQCRKIPAVAVARELF